MSRFRKSQPLPPDENCAPPRAADWIKAAILGFCVSVGLATDARAQSSTPQILHPTLGRPALVEPGLSFEMHVVDAPSEAPRVELIDPHWPKHPVAASVQLQTAAVEAGGLATYRVAAPADAPRRTYDLRLQWPNGEATTAKHTVAVFDDPSRIRIVHLGDLDVGSMTVPGFDYRLIREINLLSPTLIVLNGNLISREASNRDDLWRELLDELRMFDAPLLIASGDADDLAAYGRDIAPSPVGAVAVGRHRVVVLVDHASSPLAEDADQIDWAERTLTQRGFDGLTCVVSHASPPTLLAHWRATGRLGGMIRAGRIACWITAGPTDWDGAAHADVLAAASPMVYIQTRPASTTTAGGADGVPAYRVIDLDGSRLSMPSNGLLPLAQTPALELGRLHIRTEFGNDGLAPRATVTAINTHPVALTNLRMRARVAKAGDRRPWIRGGRIAEAVDRGAFWEVAVAFGLPDRGARRLMVGTDAPPPASPIEVTIDAPEHLTVGVDNRPQSTPISITLRNTSAAAATSRPDVYLSGARLRCRIAGGVAQADSPREVVVPARGSIVLQVDWGDARVAPGRRYLCVVTDREPVLDPIVRPIMVLRPTSPREDETSAALAARQP